MGKLEHSYYLSWPSPFLPCSLSFKISFQGQSTNQKPGETVFNDQEQGRKKQDMDPACPFPCPQVGHGQQLHTVTLGS